VRSRLETTRRSSIDSVPACRYWWMVAALLREFGYQDGVPETGFVDTWWRFRMKRCRNRRNTMAEDFPELGDAHPLDDAFWAEKRPNLEAIDVPALVCAGWSDHGLHTRGCGCWSRCTTSTDR
jgi:uncharacterized protein